MSDTGWQRRFKSNCCYCGAPAQTVIYASRTVCDDTAACRQRMHTEIGRLTSALGDVVNCLSFPGECQATMARRVATKAIGLNE